MHVIASLQTGNALSLTHIVLVDVKLVWAGRWRGEDSGEGKEAAWVGVILSADRDIGSLHVYHRGKCVL